MHQSAATRSHILETLETARDGFQRRSAGADIPELRDLPPETAAALATRVADAWNWMHTAGKEEDADEMAGDGFDFVSHNPTVSLVQAAMDQTADEDGGHGFKLPPLDVIAGHLLNLLRERPPFPLPSQEDNFCHALEEECRVVVVGDFGTGKPRAIRVAQQIARLQPHHVIHLGDVYPSGTESRCRKRFTEVWEEHGPPGARFWVLNGNHEMDANGSGYFGFLLGWAGQSGSFFSLQNEHWKLIGLDTAYRDHDLQAGQLPWLFDRLSEGGSRNILLTHHQMFSAIDDRPAKNRDRLPRTMKGVVDSGRVFGWLWGHEHRYLSYARDPRFGGYVARTLGHGGKRISYDVGAHRGPDFAPRVAHYWDVRRSGTPDECLNGFAVLDIEGPRIGVRYVDEEGGEHYPESWPDAPHS